MGFEEGEGRLLRGVGGRCCFPWATGRRDQAGRAGNYPIARQHLLLAGTWPRRLLQIGGGNTSTGERTGVEKMLLSH